MASVGHIGKSSHDHDRDDHGATEEGSANHESSSVLLWHKTYINRVRQRFDLSKYQMLWLTFGKGLAVAYAMAFLVHR